MMVLGCGWMWLRLIWVDGYEKILVWGVVVLLVVVVVVVVWG